MEKKKVLIVYERKNRELENSVLLKIVLEGNGFECDISQFYDIKYFNVLGASKYDFVFVPHLYNSKEVNRTLGRFGNKTKIINLQYEQVLSEKWEELGHHNPSGEAINAHHISWGPATTCRLLSAGVPPSFVHTVGALQTDLLKKEFRMGSKIKKELADKFDIQHSKKWVLFLSSFTYAEIAIDRLKMNESVAKTKLSSFVDIHTSSRDKILEWFDYILGRFPDKQFIYRPHPDELELDKVRELEIKFNNFRIINYGAAKQWIEACDNILSWYSTTVVESHFLEKSYSILRPIKLPNDFDSVLLKKGRFITTVDALEKCLDGDVTSSSYALRSEDVDQYYLNESTPVFEKIKTLLEELSNNDFKNFSNFIDLFRHRFTSVVLLMAVPFLLSEFKVFRGMVNRVRFMSSWRSELKSQAYSPREIDVISKDIYRRIYND